MYFCILPFLNICRSAHIKMLVTRRIKRRTGMRADKKSAPTGAGVVLRIELPRPDGLERIGAFYEKLERRCEKGCRAVLPRLCGDSGDHLYSATAVYERQGGELRVRMRIMLVERRSMRILYLHEQTHVWQVKSQLLSKIELGMCKNKTNCKKINDGGKSE